MSNEIRLHKLDAVSVWGAMGADPSWFCGRVLPIQQQDGADLRGWRGVDLQRVHFGGYAIGDTPLSRGGGDCSGNIAVFGCD